jgi:hypothetical protein
MYVYERYACMNAYMRAVVMYVKDRYQLIMHLMITDS